MTRAVLLLLLLASFAESIQLGASATPGSLTYTYDAAGNRLTRSTSGFGPGTLDSQSFAYDSNNRLLSDRYDANGNTLTSPALGITSPDSYDYANRLLSRNNGQIQLSYDGDGHRVGKKVGAISTHYLVDEINPTGWPQVLEEQTWSPGNPPFDVPAVTRVYAYGHAALAQDQLDGATWSATHFGHDAHGNVRYLTGSGGQVTDTFDYDAFGNLVARTGTTTASRLFTGEEFDHELGLYNLRARYHSPGTGRFWTRDSFEGFQSDPASRHAYTYVQNDPVNRLDPSGHIAMTEILAVSALAVETRSAVNALWGGINSYTHGLGGGQALKANSAVEGLFIQGLSQHVGVNLGRQNFWETAMNTPFLLFHNPNVFALNNSCVRFEVLGFDPNAPIYGCANRNPVFTFDFESSSAYQTALGLFEPALTLVDIAGSRLGYDGEYQGYSQTFRGIYDNASQMDPDELTVDLVSGTALSALGVITLGGSELAFSISQGDWKAANLQASGLLLGLGAAKGLSRLGEGNLVNVRDRALPVSDLNRRLIREQAERANAARLSAAQNQAARAIRAAGVEAPARTAPTATTAPNPCLPAAKSETVTYFRVQGGGSRQLINVDAAGNVTIKEGTLNISTGTAEHANYFLSKRPGGQITSFEVPSWLDDFINESAIPQKNYRSNPLNQGGLAPKLVDPTTPGTSFELPSNWAKWLEEYAVPGTGKIH